LGEICRIALGADEAGATTGNERPRIVVTTGSDTLAAALLAASTGRPPEASTQSGSEPGSRDARSPQPQAETGLPSRHAPAPVDPRAAVNQHLGPVGRQLLAALACDSILQQVVFGPSGEVLSQGREARTVTKAQRRALNARDRGCVMPGCTMPARRCQAHHVRFWRHGGDTDLDNLVLICSSCHTQIHLDTGWELVMLNGIPWTRPPGWLDPDRRLIRNTFHDHLDQARRFGTQTHLDLDLPESLSGAEPGRPEAQRGDRPPRASDRRPEDDDPGGRVG
jgi:hypothetical protein